MQDFHSTEESLCPHRDLSGAKEKDAVLGLRAEGGKGAAVKLSEDVQGQLAEINERIYPKELSVVEPEPFHGRSIYSYRVLLQETPDYRPPKKLLGFATEKELLDYLQGILDAVAVIN